MFVAVLLFNNPPNDWEWYYPEILAWLASQKNDTTPDEWTDSESKWYIQDISRDKTRARCLAHCQGFLDHLWVISSLIIHEIHISYFYPMEQNTLLYLEFRDWFCLKLLNPSHYSWKPSAISLNFGFKILWFE